MRPLNVALFVKTSPIAAERDLRSMGMWSYDVPEFTWQHFYANNFAKVDRSKLADFDVIFHEDNGFAAYYNPGPPVIYYTFDSFLSEDHRAARLKQARYANLTLVDHDDLNFFTGLNARRFPYCTNDRLYRPLRKTVDIVYHCNSGAKNGSPKAAERSELRRVLGEMAGNHGWSYASGSLGHREYATSMGQAKVVVNLSRNWLHRAHREFDAMACSACYLTDAHMETQEDISTAGKHYAVFSDDIEAVLTRLIDGDQWKDYAYEGIKLIEARHTWTVRAQELRMLINQEFGL